MAEFLLLRVRAERHDDGRHHLEAHRAHDRRAGRGHLGFENVFLRRRPARAAMFDRPVRRGPALFIERLLPFELAVLVEIAVLCLRHFAAQVLVEILGDEAADFVAEIQIVFREGEIHRSFPL
jgi:hypothetical protein